MAEIVGAVVSAVACVAQCFSPTAGHRINRLHEFKTNLQNLKTKAEILKCERLSLQRKVDLAKKNGDGIAEIVENWLERAEKIEVEIQKLLEKASKMIRDDQEAVKIRKGEEAVAATPLTGEIGRDAEMEAAAAAAGEIREDEETAEAKKRCYKGLRPDLKMRYQLSKEAEKLLEDVVKLVEDGKFDKTSYPVIPKDPRLSSKDYEAFESRASTLNNLISCLSDPNVNIVGIYGMGGVGKTTLAKEVANQTEASKLFDSVIFVEVTEKPDVRKIQQEIAEKFPNLPFSNEETDSSRAAKLCRRLKNEKKILLILDNIWAHLDLQAIGIPFGDGLKVLLTSRSVDVLSAAMESQRNFPVNLLDDEEAWQLFKRMYRGIIEGSRFESVAREIAKKCELLPISIVTVARALENKELYVWKYALQKLNTLDLFSNVFSSIELSFDYLETEILKKAILLIGYANITSIDKLLIYGMGVALFEDVNQMEGRRDRVIRLVQHLKDSCLLFDSNTSGEDFSMHDVVHDVAMSIASRCHEVLTNIHYELESLDICHSIVLKDVKTGELPQVLECQQLKLLSISGLRSYYLKLHDEFFIRTTELKVLVLDHVDLLSLPSSLGLLTNLRALGLYDCRLDDIAIIGHLEKLEILSLKHSYIEQLPEEVGQLTRLKSLDLKGCFYLDVIKPNVLSSLSHLEELYMGDFWRWKEEGYRENVSLDELKHLSSLTCLEIKIHSATTLPRDLFFNKLERYKIEIGQGKWMFYKDGIGIPKSCRNFSLTLIDTNICLNEGHIMQLKKIEDLSLSGLLNMKSVLYGLDKKGFQQLKYLQVRENDNLLCIVDATKCAIKIAFPVLESLVIHNLINLEKICYGQLTTDSSFNQLRKIEVGSCAKLENLFSFSIARRLQLLQSIDIYDCKNMNEIFAIEREDESDSNISEVIDNIEFKQLRSLRLKSLPQLKSLEYNSNCSNTLFNGKVALPSLEVLVLDEINVERIWHYPIKAMSSGNQNLTQLIISQCNNLKFLFSSSMIGSFDRLQCLEIHQCPALEEIMVIDDEDGMRKEERKNNVAFSISNINKYFKMTVSKCDKLKTLFPSNTYQKFWRLESLSIFDCGLLEVIFDLEGLDFEDKHGEVVITWLSKLDIDGLPKLKQVWTTDPKRIVSFEKLKEVRIFKCDVLKNVFPASVARSLLQLESLYISECGVEEVAFVVEEEAETNFRFVFPRLISLMLRYLPKFGTFFSRRYTMECPTSFSVGKVFPKLERLTVQGKSISTILEFPEDYIYNIRYLEINFDESIAISSLDFLQRFYNIKRLKIQGGNWECLGENGENKTSAEISNLNKCSDLMHILKESNMNHLIHLEVEFCDKLVNVLVPSLKSFQNLTSLEVRYCSALTNIVTSSTVKSMGKLREMKIAECNMITELVLADEGAEDYEIVFKELKGLHLEWLPSLICFCSSNYIFRFPSLQELVVIECPRMKSFVGGNLSTPKLQKVTKREGQIEECWNGDLNTTIQQLYEEKQMICSDYDEVNTEDEHKDDVVDSSDVKAQISLEDWGQPSMQDLENCFFDL